MGKNWISLPLLFSDPNRLHMLRLFQNIVFLLSLEFSMLQFFRLFFLGVASNDVITFFFSASKSSGDSTRTTWDTCCKFFKLSWRRSKRSPSLFPDYLTKVFYVSRNQLNSKKCAILQAVKLKLFVTAISINRFLRNIILKEGEILDQNSFCWFYASFSHPLSRF